MARVLLLSPYEPPPDGIAKHSGELVDAWVDAGHDVLVLAPKSVSTAAKSLSSQPRVARVLTPFSTSKAWGEVLNFKPDVAIVQFAIAALNINVRSVISLCRRLRASGIRVVVTFHEPTREYNLFGLATRFVYRAMAHVTDVPVVFSDAGLRALRDAHLFSNVIQVPHGTRGVATISDEQLENVRRLYGITSPLVLTLGFISFDKGVDVLLDASRPITQSRDGHVQFLVAGTPRRRRGLFRLMERRDVKCQRDLAAYVGKLSDVAVTFRDYVADENLPALLHAADVVVLPYRSITQSGIANHALSSRSVVVATDLPGLRSDLGNAALYVPVGDSAALAAQVTNLLSEGGALEQLRLRDLAGLRAAENTYMKVAQEVLAVGLDGLPRGA